jgi:threonine dehydrogenase-like Zn-dependent dehydrogenase
LHSKETPDDARAALAGKAGARYEAETAALDSADIVIEAAGVPAAGFLAMDRLAPNGVCALIGARPGQGEMPFRRMILENQTVFGSVSASPEAFRAAVEDLARFDTKVLDAMLHRVPLDAFPQSVSGPAGQAVKVVHVVE